MNTRDNILGDGIGFVKLIDHMGNDLSVVNAARVSFGKRKDLLTKKDEVLINYLAEHKHTSPFEHVTFTFLIECPLFVRSQWMRHRTWSYNEISRRYTTEDIKFFIPTELRTQDTTENLQGSDGVLNETDNTYLLRKMNSVVRDNYEFYEQLLDKGVANEMARMILPQNMYTKFYGTVNLHNLVHFLKLRIDSHAQKEIQLYGNAISEIVEELLPISYHALMNN